MRPITAVQTIWQMAGDLPVNVSNEDFYRDVSRVMGQVGRLRRPHILSIFRSQTRRLVERRGLTAMERLVRIRRLLRRCRVRLDGLADRQAERDRRDVARGEEEGGEEGPHGEEEEGEGEAPQAEGEAERDEAMWEDWDDAAGFIDDHLLSPGGTWRSPRAEADVIVLDDSGTTHYSPSPTSSGLRQLIPRPPSMGDLSPDIFSSGCEETGISGVEALPPSQ